jgi:hypothetical protein
MITNLGKQGVNECRNIGKCHHHAAPRGTRGMLNEIQVSLH